MNYFLLLQWCCETVTFVSRCFCSQRVMVHEETYWTTCISAHADVTRTNFPGLSQGNYSNSKDINFVRIICESEWGEKNLSSPVPAVLICLGSLEKKILVSEILSSIEKNHLCHLCEKSRVQRKLENPMNSFLKQWKGLLPSLRLYQQTYV